MLKVFQFNFYLESEFYDNEKKMEMKFSFDFYLENEFYDNEGKL